MDGIGSKRLEAAFERASAGLKRGRRERRTGSVWHCAGLTPAWVIFRPPSPRRYESRILILFWKTTCWSLRFRTLRYRFWDTADPLLGEPINPFPPTVIA